MSREHRQRAMEVFGAQIMGLRPMGQGPRFGSAFGFDYVLPRKPNGMTGYLVEGRFLAQPGETYVVIVERRPDFWNTYLAKVIGMPTKHTDEASLKAWLGSVSAVPLGSGTPGAEAVGAQSRAYPGLPPGWTVARAGSGAVFRSPEGVLYKVQPTLRGGARLTAYPDPQTPSLRMSVYPPRLKGSNYAGPYTTPLAAVAQMLSVHPEITEHERVFREMRKARQAGDYYRYVEAHRGLRSLRDFKSGDADFFDPDAPKPPAVRRPGW